MKGFFASRSILFQLGALFYFLLIGLLLSSLTSFIINNIAGLLHEGELKDSSYVYFYTTQSIQFISSAFIFIFPALCIAYFCSHTPYAFLYIKKGIDGKVLLLSAAMIILISPTIEITSYLNYGIHLPEFMAPVENWIRETESHTSQIVDRLLSKEGVLPFLTNILVIGVMAGVAEELLFRGALLSLIRKKVKNPHIAIWLVAFIFSAIHFQFLGFIPRMLLGAFLGYLLLWTNNIWVPIFAHFMNNTISIIGHRTGLFQQANSPELITSETSTSEMFITIIAAIVGLGLFALCAKKMREICSSHEKT